MDKKEVAFAATANMHSRRIMANEKNAALPQKPKPNSRGAVNTENIRRAEKQMLTYIF